MDYYTRPEWSQTELKKLLDNPARAWYDKRNAVFEETPTLTFGKAVHDVILEDGIHIRCIERDADYIKLCEQVECDKLNFAKLDCSTIANAKKLDILEVYTDLKNAINDSKEKLQEFIEEYNNSSKPCSIMISGKDYDKAYEMRNALMNNSTALGLLSGAEVEKEFLSTMNSLPVRGKLDAINGKIGIDYKTTNKLSDFAKSIANFGYHFQDVFYTDLAQLDDFVFIVQEKTAPYCSAIYRISESARDLAYDKIKEAIELAKQCEKGSIAEHVSEIQEIDIPNWAYYN